MVQISGGSQGDIDNAQSNSNSIFQPNVKFHKLKVNKNELVRILPAFDFSLNSEDTAFPTSYVSYRDREAPQDEETGTPGFTEWYFSVQAYNFWGREKKNLLSPITGQPNPSKGKDPIFDLYVAAKNHQDPTYKMLTQKKPNAEGISQPILRYPQTLVLVNALMQNDKTNKLENRIVMFTGSALRHLKQALKMKPGRDDKVITEEWSEFMLGDVTDPKSGALATSKPIEVGTNTNVQTSGLVYTNDMQTLDGYQEFRFDPNSADGQAYLGNRYNIKDVDNIFVIPSYDEIVSCLVADGEVPYEFIESVCAPYMTESMPKKPMNVVVGPQQQQGFGQPQQNQQQSQPPQQNQQAPQPQQGFGQPQQNQQAPHPQQGFGQPQLQQPQQGFGIVTDQQAAVNQSLQPNQNDNEPADDIPMDSNSSQGSETAKRLDDLAQKISSGSASAEEIQEYAKLKSS